MSEDDTARLHQHRQFLERHSDTLKHELDPRDHTKAPRPIDMVPPMQIPERFHLNIVTGQMHTALWGEWMRSDAYDRLRAERDRMRDSLEAINTMACYASEEDTESREKVLRMIGSAARSALTATTEPEKEA